MPASSKAQQKFMNVVHSVQKGDTKPSDVSQSVRDAAKSMSKKDAKDFADTLTGRAISRLKQPIPTTSNPISSWAILAAEITCEPSPKIKTLLPVK